MQLKTARRNILLVPFNNTQHKNKVINHEDEQKLITAISMSLIDVITVQMHLPLDASLLQLETTPVHLPS